MALLKMRGCQSKPDAVLAYITAPDKAACVSTWNIDESRDFALQLEQTRLLYGKNSYDERKYYHVIVSAARKDNATPEQHHAFAMEVAKKFFKNFEFVVATHIDTQTVNSHIVVSATSIATGKKLHLSNGQYARMKDKVDEIGEKYGFSRLDWRKAVSERRQEGIEKTGETKAEVEIMKRGDVSWKDELREVIEAAKTLSATMDEFENHLMGYGVVITRNTEKTLSFKHPDKEKAIRAEKLGFTKGEILDELAKNKRRSEHHTNGRTEGTAGEGKSGNDSLTAREGSAGEKNLGAGGSGFEFEIFGGGASEEEHAAARGLDTDDIDR